MIWANSRTARRNQIAPSVNSGQPELTSFQWKFPCSFPLIRNYGRYWIEWFFDTIRSVLTTFNAASVYHGYVREREGWCVRVSEFKLLAFGVIRLNLHCVCVLVCTVFTQPYRSQHMLRLHDLPVKMAAGRFSGCCDVMWELCIPTTWKYHCTLHYF